MAGAELFGELPQQQGPRRDVAGDPRLREPQRDQIEWRSMDIDSLIGTDHPARTIWAFVEGLDLLELEDASYFSPHKIRVWRWVDLRCI